MARSPRPERERRRSARRCRLRERNASLGIHGTITAYFSSCRSTRPTRRCRKSRIGRARVVTTLQKLGPARESVLDAEEKKRSRRADLRNCPAADDEIVPGRTRRDGRQAGTAVTLRSCVPSIDPALTTPSPSDSFSRSRDTASAAAASRKLRARTRRYRRRFGK